MLEELQRIKAISGVSGSFVCDEEGKVLESALGRDLDAHRLHLVTRTLAQTLAGLRTVQKRRLGDLDLTYHKGRLLVKPLSGGALGILCTPQVNIPLINLTADVAARKIAAEMREARRRDKIAEPATPAEPSAPPPPATPEPSEPTDGVSPLQRFLRPFGK